MKLIDKDAVVAEIKRRKEINKYRDTNDSLFEDEAILSFINRVASVNVKAHELVLIDVDSVRDDFMAEIYRILDGDPTNDRANAIINAFDSLPTVFTA